GLSAESTCSSGLSTEGPPLDRFRYSSVATRVIKNVPAIAAIKILFPLRVKAGLFLLALSNDPYGPRWLLIESLCVYSPNRGRFAVVCVTEFTIDRLLALNADASQSGLVRSEKHTGMKHDQSRQPP